MTAPANARSPEGERGRIPLPPPLGSTRAMLRRRRRQQLRRRAIWVTASVLALVVAVSVVVALPDSEARKGAATVAPAAAARHLPRLLVAHGGPDGHAQSLTLLAPGAEGGTILLVPVGTMAEVSSLGLEPIGSSLALGGPDRLVATVENLMGIEIDDIVVLSDADLVAMVQALGGPLLVNIPTRVEEVDATGRVEILYEPGVVEVGPAEVPRMLTSRGRDTALALLARHQAFWQAVLELVDRQSPASLRAPDPVPTIRVTGAIPERPPVAKPLVDALLAMRSEEVRVQAVPVEAVGRSDEAGQIELFQVKAKDLLRMLQTAFPDERARLANRPRVQILNGTGQVELAPRVAAKLLPAGVQIALTGNAPRFDYEETQVVFYDRSKQAMADRVRRALGTGRLVLSRNPLDVVDVTVIVGKDFLRQ